MEKLTKQIILNCEQLEQRLALLANGRLEEYEVERENNDPKTGNIYLGKIINFDPSLQAVFVDIGADKNAFLHYHDLLPEHRKKNRTNANSNSEEISNENISAKRKQRTYLSSNSKAKAEELRRKKNFTVNEVTNHFHKGMEILVQVTKGPIGTKGARVTTEISIPGRYLVLMPYCEHIGLSSKIEGSVERERLRKILSTLELLDGMGLICRTVGEGRKAMFFKRDLGFLLDSWRNIEKDMQTSTAPSLLFAESNLIERSVRDFMTAEINGVVVDSKEAYNFIVDKLKRIGVRKMASKVTLYNSPKPVFEHYMVSEQIKAIFHREVKLPGGGAICIDETEALIAIDVNSGRGRKGADQPEFILKTNLEAAEEVARQLRLRNVGGLVVIDFIDMKTAKDRDEVYKHFKKCIKDDRAKTKTVPISKFGLLEMTRQREHESIKDQIYSTCPYCGGSGCIKSKETMSVEIQRRLNSLLKKKQLKTDGQIRIIMHPDVLNRLKTEDAKILEDLEKKYKYKLSFRSDESLHYEEFNFINPETGESLI